MNVFRRRVSSAHLIALLALFVALGGSAYAIHLGKNAVKTKNIKDGAVIESKLAGGAVSASKLAPGAVGAASIRGVVVRSSTIPLPDGSGPSTTVHCSPGEVLLGGTGRVNAGGSSDVAIEGIYPEDSQGSSIPNGQAIGSAAGLFAQFHNFLGGPTGSSFGSVYAYCLK